MWHHTVSNQIRELATQFGCSSELGGQQREVQSLFIQSTARFENAPDEVLGELRPYQKEI
jgi:hypothetical protein